jgi:hypothetical protein
VHPPLRLISFTYRMFNDLRVIAFSPVSKEEGDFDRRRLLAVDGDLMDSIGQPRSPYKCAK